MRFARRQGQTPGAKTDGDRVLRKQDGLGVELAKPFIKGPKPTKLDRGLKGAAAIGPPAITFAPNSGATLSNQLFGAAAGAVFILCMW